MPFPTYTAGAYTVVALSGDVDLHESPRARSQILGLVEQGLDVLVDLSRVTYIDSSGVASLVEGYQLARRNKARFALVGVSEAAMQVLKLARLDQVLPVYDTVPELPAR